ncbi:MAG: Ig-like domain-containing protein [Bacteroidaceae bacterium]|nr:Ig-like domain-containing protein [Bacteroidaceae bacterium]
MTATLTVKSVTKVIPVTAVTLTEQTLSLTKGESTVLDGYVKITPENATNKAVTWKTSDEAVATVTNANGVWTVKAVGGGEAELTVVSADNAQASAKMTLKVTVPLTGLAFAKPVQELWAGETVDITWTPTPQDANSYKVVIEGYDQNVFEYASGNAPSMKVRANAPAGEYTVKAVAYSADGKALNVSAEMKVTVKVHVSALSISDEYAQKPLTLLKGTSVSLDGFVTVTPSTAYDKKLTWTSSDEHIAVVTEKEGTWSVTGISAGETTLKVTSVDNPALSAELKVTVTVAVSGITIKSEYAKQTLWLGTEPLALTKAMYTITPSDATNAAVAWSSSDESVVAVSQNATTGAWVATPKKVGSATLTVKTLEGGFTATMAVEVKAHVTSFKLTTQTLTLDKGAAATLDDYVGEVLPADASDKSISWRTADGEKGVSVAQHDGKWIVTANAVGEYTLTAYSVDNPQLTQTLKVVVSAVAGGISVTSPIQSVYPGGALDLSYTIDTDDPSSFSVTWTSSNTDVVSVTKGNDGQWTATALKSGTATLTVKTTPGDKTATIRVTVWSHVDALSLTEQTLALTKGQSAVLDKMVTITPADAHDKTVTWTSSNPSVAAVAYADGSWSVKALAGGEAVLTVASEDNPKAVAQLAVTVTVPLEGITAVNPRQTVEVNAAVDLTLTFSPSDASRQTVTWTSSEPTVVAVSKSAEGVWTAVAKASGSALLTAKSDDGGHTATVMVTVPYHVTRILLSAQQIVRNPGAVFNPDDFVHAVEPKEVVDKSLTWTSSNPSVVKIEGKPGAYTATTLAVGTATLTAASVDNPAVKATLTVTVEAAVGGISVKNPVQSLYPGGLIDLSYTINSADAGSVAVEWTSDNSSVVEVKKSSNGTWTANALKSGKAVLTVTTTPGHKTATIAVTVWAHVDALSLTQQTLSLMKGASAALDGYVKITPADAHDKAVRWTSSDPSIASASEAGGTWTVIAHAGGDAVLTATSADNPKATAKMTVKVAVPLEGLAFVNPVQTVFAGELVDVAWTPTPADALSYEVKLEYDPNVFTLSTTVQHSLAVNMQAPAGDYVVKAVAYSKDGTPLGIAAELKVTVKRHVEKIEVSLAGVLTLAIGDVVTLDDYIKVLPADAADKGYTVQSANPAVVSVSKDANGLYRLAALSAGETSVEIVSTDNPSIKATVSIKVAAEVIKLEGLSFNTPVQTVYAGEQIDGTWTATPANAANYIVNLEFNQDVFTILPSAQGKLQVAADAPAGDYTITARAFGLDGKELGITATLKVTIKKHVSSITLTEQTLTLKKGQTTKMDGFVKFTPEDAADRRLQWTSSDASVVALREEGGSWTASALAGGTATLTVTSLDNPEAKAVMTVVVIVPLEGVVADHPQQTVEVGSSVDLSCTFTPADATDTQIRWSSSDESVVAVTETAEGGWAAMAKGSGNAVLTGRTHEGGYVATITVTVPYHVTAITLTTSTLALKPGDTFNPDTYVKAVVPEQAADKSLTWTSSDESVVKIEGTPGAYTATAVGVGEVTLTVRSNDRPEVTATLQITVAEEVIPLTGLAFAAPSQTVFAGEEVNVTWTPTPANANFYSVKLTYDEAVFELMSGVMKVRPSVAAGDYQIVAQAYDADGEAMAVRAVLTVTVRTHVSGIVLSDELGDEPLSVTKDETVVLDGYVTVTPADAYNQRVVWTSSNTSVATVAEKDGVWSVTGISLGEATLTVTSADNPDVSARVSVVVVAGIIPVTGFDMADAVSMTKDSGAEVIKLTPIPADATVDVSKFSVAVSDIYGQGKDWRYLDVNVREQDGQYEAVINAAYVWGINAFDVLYDGKKMGSVSVNVGADFSFAKGWNWISTPYADYAAAGLAKVELDDMGKTFGDALQEVRSSDALLYKDPDMGYFGDFSGLTSAKMYQFHFNADPTNNLVLYNINRYDGGSASINAGWTWLAYPYEYAYTPAELAKAGVFDAAVEGDRIVAQDGFAEFSDGKWSGTLTRLQPTAGLMYFRNAEGRSAVAWKGYDALGQKLPAQDGGQAGANGRRDGRRVWDYDARAFADNMTVVAAFDGIDFPENCTVGAFVDGECRGQGQYADGRYFITVHGAAGESVSFVLYDEQSGDYWTVQGSLSFSDKAGSIKTPLRLKVGERTTAIPNLQMADGDASERTIHDLQGRRVLNPEKGVYIIQGEKKIIK